MEYPILTPPDRQSAFEKAVAHLVARGVNETLAPKVAGIEWGVAVLVPPPSSPEEGDQAVAYA
jgi:hypothetical protein